MILKPGDMSALFLWDFWCWFLFVSFCVVIFFSPEVFLLVVVVCASGVFYLFGFCLVGFLVVVFMCGVLFGCGFFLLLRVFCSDADNLDSDVKYQVSEYFVVGPMPLLVQSK